VLKCDEQMRERSKGRTFAIVTSVHFSTVIHCVSAGTRIEKVVSVGAGVRGEAAGVQRCGNF